MSSSEIKNVIIVGASGNLGPTVLRVFLQHSHFNITVLSRSTSSATFPSGVNVLRADFNSIDSLTAAFKGQDAVVSLIAGAAIGDQNKLIDAAIAAGVKRFLPSDFGSNTADERFISIVPILQAKKDTVEYLKSKGDQISWNAVVNGLFFDWGSRVGFLGINATTKTATLIDEGAAPFCATNVQTIGQAIVKVLKNPELTKNRYIYVSSFVTSQVELLRVFENISGEKYDVTKVTSEELIARGNERLKKQDYWGFGDLVQGATFGTTGLGDYRGEGLWNEKLGLEKEDLANSVKIVLSGKLVGEE